MYDELHVLENITWLAASGKNLGGTREPSSGGQEAPGSLQGWSKLQSDHRRGVSSHL